MSLISIRSLREFAKQHEKKTVGHYRRYSVLIPIVVIDDELFILYEVRSNNLKTQPGEISFPGGGVEKGETRMAAAIRETCEEIGVSPRDIDMLGEMDKIVTYSNSTMYSFLGIIDYEALKGAKFNKDEVQETFLVPIDFFLKNKPDVYESEVIPLIGEDFPYDKIKFKDGYNWRKGQTEIPIYQYEDYTIWGLTARLTKSLIDNIETFLG